MTDELAGQQLEALGRVHELLEAAGVAYSLFGGWAVDFHAGRVTRGHDDVDVAVWLSDAGRIAQLLEQDGWRHAPSEDEDGGTGYERGAVRLELTYLVRDTHGRASIPLSTGRVPWWEDGLGEYERELQGVRARLVGLDALAWGKAAPRSDPGDAAKDRADHVVLAELGASDEPAG